MPGAAVNALLAWKAAFLNRKIAAINAKIAANSAKIAALRALPDTEQQIESYEHINAGLEQEKQEIEDELSRFNNGSEGHKYNMAKRNIGNEIHRLHKDAVEHVARAAADLAAADALVDIEKAATEEVRDG